MTADPELQALASARRALMIRIAMLVAAVMLFIGAVVYVAMLIAQNMSVERDLHYVAERSAVNSPPGCAWLVVDHDGTFASSHGTPVGFPLRAGIDRVAAGSGPIEDSVSRDNTTYRVLTQRRGADIVQAVYDERFQAEDRQSLLIALLAAELVGMAGAIALGGLLARRSIAPLGEALRRQRTFVADASHELRTPLTRLHTRAQLLVRRSETVPPERVRVELGRIVEGTGRLSEVLDDLLLSALLRSTPRPFGTVDLAALAAEAVDADGERARQNGLTLRVETTNAPYRVTGIETALRRVVTALVDNAIGHTPPGGHIVLTVGAGPDDERTEVVRLAVRDNGVGFDQRESGTLFDRFTRGEAGKGHRFGIGLALVREVVASHSGTIVAESGAGGGAVFTLTLPAAGAEELSADTAVRIPAQPGEPKGHARLTRVHL